MMNSLHADKETIKIDVNDVEQEKKEDIVDEILRRNREIMFINWILNSKRDDM